MLVLVGLLAADDVGRVGGLLKELPAVIFVAEVDVGLLDVDILGAIGLVNGRFGGIVLLRAAVESESAAGVRARTTVALSILETCYRGRVEIAGSTSSHAQ